ncbi:MAG: alpha/beta hydrolase [Bacteroidota bacterium]
MSTAAYNLDTEQIPQPATIKRPSILWEASAMFQPLRLLASYPKLRKAPKGNGERIILFPGWLSHDTVMYPIKKYLQQLGYAPEYWGLGINKGQVEIDRNRMIAKLEKEDSDEKVILMGWSLGGLIAREVAREMPDKIEKVITYGTPVVGGPKYTIGEKVYSKELVEEIHATIQEFDATNPIQVPIRAIFTKNDSIVNWSACIDRTSKDVQHFEVDSTHFSLGVDPKVWEIIANILAGPTIKFQ